MSTKVVCWDDRESIKYLLSNLPSSQTLTVFTRYIPTLTVWGFYHAHDSRHSYPSAPRLQRFRLVSGGDLSSLKVGHATIKTTVCYNQSSPLPFFIFRSLRFLSVGHSVHPSSTRREKTNCRLRLPDGVPGKSLLVIPSCYDAATDDTTNYCGRLVSGPVSCEETNGWVGICAISWS